ncbi:MAG: lysine--tRNA ligase [Candidatus Woesearchaeota archaeon]
MAEKSNDSKKKNKKDRTEQEHNHWADQIALEVKKRVDEDPKLKKVMEKVGYYLIYDEKTPSGTIHVGSGRGWVIHDAIAKAMRNLGMKAKFVLSNDDIDPYDKPNKELDESWNKYLGMPFRNIPSPVEGYESFGDYYFMQCVEKFEELGIEAEIESTGAEYEKGTFNKAIKKVLDNHKQVQKLYLDMYGEDSEASKKIPFNVICEKCGKIATTIATEWDTKTELLSYECKKGNGIVTWAEGCGHKGKISPYNGNGKFPWKVEWPAKWISKGVLCEFAGKDHFTKGGSRSFGVKLSHELFDFMPPYPSDRRQTGKGYEFFQIGGKKMSTSKGRGVAFIDMTEILPPNLVRFLLIKPRPNSVIDFDPYNDNNITFLFDWYDRAERIYFDKEEKVDEKEKKMQSRMYELSHVGKLPNKMPVQIPIKFAAIIIQIALDNEEQAIEILQSMGHLPKKLEGIDRHYVLQRLNDAKRWINKFASDNYKFELNSKDDVQTKIRAGELKLDHKVKKALQLVVKKLEERAWEDKELHDEFYNICKSIELEPKEFFTGAYMLLIGKERGPLLAKFILAVGLDRFRELVEEL